MFPIFSTVTRTHAAPTAAAAASTTSPAAAAASPASTVAVDALESPTLPSWETLPLEVRADIASRMTAKDLAVFSSTSKANLALARSPQVLLHQTPNEATQTLWHLARTGSAEAIAELIRLPHVDRIDWNSRNAEGATLLMAALKYFSPEVVDALAKGPTGLFAGVDNNGDNILHHVIDRAGSATLDQMLTKHPLLAGYIDLPNRQDRTPLATAYQKSDEGALARLSRPAIHEIDRLIDRTPASLREMHTREHSSQEGGAHSVATQVTVQARRNVDVFPFDREGIPSEVDAFKRWMPHFRLLRRPAQSRLDLACQAINHGESSVLGHLLRTLPIETLRESRDNLTRAVLHTGHCPSVRVIARIYGDEMFVPLAYDENVLHLAACNGSTRILEWLFRQDRAVDLLHQADDAGRTPILRAAEYAQLNCIETLAAHYPAGSIIDQDQQGRGLLYTLLRRDPEVALQLFRSGTWQERISPDDKTQALGSALHHALERNYRFSSSDDESSEYDETLPDYLGLVMLLLQVPRGQINVHASISPSGVTIINLLQNEELLERLDDVVSAIPWQVRKTFDWGALMTASGKIRALAHVHVAAPGLDII